MFEFFFLDWLDVSFALWRRLNSAVVSSCVTFDSVSGSLVLFFVDQEVFSNQILYH